MSDLFDKLNVLVRARLNSALGGGEPGQRGPGERTPKDLGDLEREIGTLRQHIDDALNSEDAMQQKLDAVNAQADKLDQQADNALVNGDEAGARAAVQQLQRLRQQGAIQQADLETHRRATSDLIEKVNTLDALLSDARSRDEQPAAPAEAAQPTQQTAQALDGPARSVPIKIHRDPKPSETVNDQVKAVVDQAKVEDDLAARRARLSKPDGS